MARGTLTLLRHAKSSWKDAAMDDFDRPLASRGKRDGKRFGQRLQQCLPKPDLVLCSTARRARETLAFLSPELVDAAVVRYEGGLYLASAATLLERLRGLPDDSDHVLLVGHNPGLTDLVNLLLGPAADAIDNLPTFGVAVFAVTGPWAQLDAAGARLTDLLRPRDGGDERWARG
jgi:phosphohistidine phosphatase